MLNAAPRCGPFNIKLGPYVYSFDALEWSCPNRFVWTERNGTNIGWRSGYFNGIDYMVLHNLYWLTRVDASESTSIYKDQVIENQVKNITAKSEHVYARYSVKLTPGFKVTGNSTYSYNAGTNPDMRTGYDSNMPFTKQNVDFCLECDPIIKDNPLKSARITLDEGKEALEPIYVSLFPNPANNLLTVSSNELLQSITVMNATGKMCLDFADINAETLTLDISGLSQGIYIVKTITLNGYEKVEKLLKQE